MDFFSTGFNVSGFCLLACFPDPRSSAFDEDGYSSLPECGSFFYILYVFTRVRNKKHAVLCCYRKIIKGMVMKQSCFFHPKTSGSNMIYSSYSTAVCH